MSQPVRSVCVRVTRVSTDDGAHAHSRSTHGGMAHEAVCAISGRGVTADRSAIVAGSNSGTPSTP